MPGLQVELAADQLVLLRLRLARAWSLGVSNTAHEYVIVGPSTIR